MITLVIPAPAGAQSGKALKLEDASLAQRLWARVLKTEHCWEWQGRRRYGYGFINAHGKRSTPERVHRVAYALEIGPIPAGMLVCHRCDNRACVRPDHLFLGTNAENMEDMKRKGRAKSRRGAEHHNTKLTVSQAKIIKGSSLPSTVLAKQLNVPVTCVYNLRHGKTWKYITP